MGFLYQQADAVTRIFLTATGAAMQQVFQYGQGIFDYLVRLAPFYVHHETHAAGIMFHGRVIKPLSRWPLPVYIF